MNDPEQQQPTDAARPAEVPVRADPPNQPDDTSLDQLWEQHGRRVSLRRVGRVLLVLGSLTLVGWLFWNSWAALLPFQIGVVVAYLLLPLVNRLDKHMPRWAAIVLVYLLSIGVFITAMAFVVPPLVEQSNEVLDRLPPLSDVSTRVGELFAAFEAFQQTLPPELAEPVDDAINQAIETLQSNLTTYVQEAGSLLVSSTMGLLNTLSFVLGFVIVPFWLFYVMKDQHAGREALNNMLPSWVRDDFWAVLTLIDRVFSSYIRGQLFLGLMVGLAAWVGLTVLDLAGFDIQYTLLLAVIAGITELIPLIGPVIGAIPAIAMGFMDSPTTALAVVVLYALIQQLENNFLVPRIVGESVGLHPAVLMVVLVVMSQFGLLGIILSAPLAAVGRDIFRYVYGRLSDPPQPAGLLPETATEAAATDVIDATDKPPAPPQQ